MRQRDEGRNALAGKRIGKCAAVNGAGVQVVMVAGAGVETLFQDAQAATVAENGTKHSDKQVVIFECFAVLVCVVGVDVALENTVHDGLD